MKLGRLSSSVVLVLGAFVITQAPCVMAAGVKQETVAPARQNDGSHDKSEAEPLGIVPGAIQNEAPAFSSPRVRLAPNGDRESHYPPYYHPED